MSIKVGDSLHCKESFVCEYSEEFSIEKNETVIIDQFDSVNIINHPTYIRIEKTSGPKVITWCWYKNPNNTEIRSDIKYVWDHFEKKINRAKRIIDGYKSR